jgi:hypothetical protein
MQNSSLLISATTVAYTSSIAARSLIVSRRHIARRRRRSKESKHRYTDQGIVTLLGALPNRPVGVGGKHVAQLGLRKYDSHSPLPIPVRLERFQVCRRRLGCV